MWKMLITIILFLEGCASNKNEKIIASMVPFEPKITISNNSQFILIEDFERNITLLYNENGQLVYEQKVIHPISFFSVDSSNLFHVTNENELIKFNNEQFELSLEEKPDLITLSESKQKLITINRTKVLNQAKLSVYTYSPFIEVNTEFFPIYSHAVIQATNDFELVTVYSNDNIDEEDEKFALSTNQKYNDFIQRFKNTKVTYSHKILNQIRVLIADDFLYIENDDFYKTIPGTPNQKINISPNSEVILIYQIEELKNISALKIKCTILNSSNLEIINSFILNLNSSKLPELTIDNNLKIHQISYENGNYLNKVIN